MTNTSICGLCQGFDPRPTRRRHRAKRTRRGPIGATAAGRDPGREPIHISFDITTRPLGATPLRRAGPAAAGAVPGRWPLRGRESPQDRPPGRGAQCAFTASHECDHHRVTSLRTLVMRSVVILIGYTHISTTTAALGHLSHHTDDPLCRQNKVWLRLRSPTQHARAPHRRPLSSPPRRMARPTDLRVRRPQTVLATSLGHSTP